MDRSKLERYGSSAPGSSPAVSGYKLQEYVDAYLDAADMWQKKKAPLFPALHGRRELTEEPLPRQKACNPHEEKLVVWVLLDTGLRVSELVNLKRANLDWQTHRLMIYGKGPSAPNPSAG